MSGFVFCWYVAVQANQTGNKGRGVKDEKTEARIVLVQPLEVNSKV